MIVQNSNFMNGYCSLCGERVTSTLVDMGIGHVEYWGASYVHEDWQKISPCCEDVVIPESEYKNLLKDYVLDIYDNLKSSLDSKSSYKISKETKEFLKVWGNANIIKGDFAIEFVSIYNKKCFEHFWVQINDIIIDLSCYKFNNFLKNKMDKVVVDFECDLNCTYLNGQIFEK